MLFLGTTHKVKCPSLWKYLPNSKKCYRTFQQATTWENANKKCRKSASGGHLASVRDKETKKFLSNLTKKASWIGGFRERNKSQFINSEVAVSNKNLKLSYICEKGDTILVLHHILHSFTDAK